MTIYPTPRRPKLHIHYVRPVVPGWVIGLLVLACALVLCGVTLVFLSFLVEALFVLLPAIAGLFVIALYAVFSRGLPRRL